MKKLLFSLSMLVAIFAIQAQVVIFQDNFDSYTPDVKLCVQNHINWDTWSGGAGTAEDAMVTDEIAVSGNAVFFDGSVDIIYKFDNQTNGYYRIEFDMYVPSSENGGYFNVQKTKIPGTAWAFEVYFKKDGTGYLMVGGSTATTYTFPAPCDAWNHIKVDIDLDNDLATLVVNTTTVHSWPYHYVATGTTGVTQLGGVNLYAGSPVGSSTSGTYLVDNYVITEVSAATPGILEITPETPIVVDARLTTPYTTYSLALKNIGASSIDYQSCIVYDIPNPNTTPTTPATMKYFTTLSSAGVLWNNTTTANVACGFPSSLLQGHIGKQLKQIYFNATQVHNATGAKVCIWKMGPMGTPSVDAPIYEQVITLSEGDNNVTLTTPYTIDGSDIYFGWQFSQVPGTEQSLMVVAGRDDTPVASVNPLGNLTKTGPAWSHLTLDGHWAIAGTINGTPIKPWIQQTWAAAAIAPDQTRTMKLTFGATDVVMDDIKSAKLYIASTDYMKEETWIDITVNFIIAINEQGNIEVKLYPNPATNGTLSIESNSIKMIEVYNMVGQKVFGSTYDTDKAEISTSNWQAGTYVVKVTTADGATNTQKVTVK